MTGYEELDANGDWIADGSYGTVWVPRAVPVGWAPYRYGRWRWVSPWGWTWVDAAPWGYAPFHYGRWVMVGGRWGWWPGSYVARPVWAPALVGFVGTGGASVSVGFGGPLVGWYPLAPWHPYRPHYRTNTTYVTVINQTIIQRPPPGVPRDARRNVRDRPGYRSSASTSPLPRFASRRRRRRSPTCGRWRHRRGPSARRPSPTTCERGYARSRCPTPGARRARASPRATPKFSTTPPQPLPGANGTLSQPAPIRGPEPRATPPAPSPQPEVEAPRPKPHMPSEIVPPYQQLQKPFPAEPARTPPAAPPTVRQPPVSRAPTAPRGVAAPPAQPHPSRRRTGSARRTTRPHSAHAASAAHRRKRRRRQSRVPARTDRRSAAPRPDVPRPKKNVMEK